MTTRNQKRMDRIREVLGCPTDTDLAERFSTNQPRISYWRNKGFHASTANMLDSLLSELDARDKFTRALERDLRTLRRASLPSASPTPERFSSLPLICLIAQSARWLSSSHSTLPPREVKGLYCELIRLLRNFCEAPEDFTEALNSFGVPLPPGEGGEEWTVEVAGDLLDRCSD